VSRVSDLVIDGVLEQHRALSSAEEVRGKTSAYADAWHSCFELAFGVRVTWPEVGSLVSFFPTQPVLGPR
jgi:hypothetical protein